MSVRRFRLCLVASCVVGAVVLTACTAKGGGRAMSTTTTRPDSHATTTDAPTTTSDATTTTEPRSSTTVDRTPDTIEEMKDLVRGALLVPADVGDEFEETTSASGSSRGPCTDTRPDDVVSPPIKESTLLVDASRRVSIQEVIRVYDDEAEATRALPLFRALVDCTSGTITTADGGKIEVEIDEISDDFESVDDHIEEGFGVGVSDPKSDAYLVTVRFGAALVTLSFVSPPDVAEASLPVIDDVVSAAVTKAATA